MNMNFDFNNPTKILFGSGKLNELGSQPLPGKKALLLMSGGKSAKVSGAYDRTLEQLRKAGVEVTEFAKVMENPVKETVMEGAAFAKENGCDFIVALGGGAVLANASDELRAFAHKIQAPVADSLMGKGAFDGADELYTGMVGMHGTKTSNFGITEADLLIVVGARFSDRVTGNASKFAKNAKILQLDIDPAEINKNIKVDASIIGDVKVILRKLNARLDPVNHDEWIAHIERMKDMYPLRYDKNLLTGPFIVQTINEVTGGDAVIVTEVGQHQMWAAQYYQYRQPRTLLTSGGLGTMGYGLGAAIGAKMGCRDKTVINIAGDGCFRMNMNEIATATRYNIPVVEVIVNNHVLGMVRQWQTLFYGKRYSQTILNDSVDFVKIAEAMGARAYRVTQKEELEPVLREAISLNIPVVIDCQISCDDKVFPMVSPGAPIADAFDDTDLKIN